MKPQPLDFNEWYEHLRQLSAKIGHEIGNPKDYRVLHAERWTPAEVIENELSEEGMNL